jgi:hypothetical protein
LKALVELYADVQQACHRAAEVKASRRRHLASYFKVAFYGATHFGYIASLFLLVFLILQQFVGQK